ncbi:MAG: ImmA/IrrE family metallo-endopeptidase, partial [Prosthecobacter sp.]|nr:ImmA/IrrE family metallo-endopeptidase [Prosthecobacter sp.]
LKRSPSAAAVSTSVDAAMAVEDGLTRPDFSSLAFEMFLQSPKRQTNCLWDFMEDLVLDSGFSRSQARQVANRRTKTINQVPFLGKPELEDRSSAILSDLGYVGGEVSLDQLCARETWRSKLTVMTDVAPPTELGSAVLGRIVFDPLVIEVYAQPTPNRGRERFTLAHELAHHLLDHGRYLLHETCEDGDFVLHRPDLLNTGDIARMEFQANVLAACLLMPKACIIADFRRVARSLGIANKGFGELYVDAQPCNLMNYEALTHQLMECYGVSRAAIKIRLESLGLLCDARDQTNLHSVQRLLSQA